MITTIIFDLSEVYLTGLLGIEEEISKFINKPPEEVLNDINDELLILLFKGKITEDYFWENINTKKSWNIDPILLKKLVRNNFNEISGTRDIIEELKKSFKLGLLSVHSKEWIEFCEKKFNYQ